jgi:hypothetical protein
MCATVSWQSDAAADDATFIKEVIQPAALTGYTPCNTLLDGLAF